MENPTGTLIIHVRIVTKPARIRKSEQSDQRARIALRRERKSKEDLSSEGLSRSRRGDRFPRSQGTIEHSMIDERPFEDQGQSDNGTK